MLIDVGKQLTMVIQFDSANRVNVSRRAPTRLFLRFFFASFHLSQFSGVVQGHRKVEHKTTLGNVCAQPN